MDIAMIWIAELEMCLTQHQLWPILQRLCQMHGLDFFTPRQIRNRARQLENSMIRPRRQIELRYRRSHQHSIFRNPLLALRYEYQYDLAVDLKFVSDIL